MSMHETTDAKSVVINYIILKKGKKVSLND